LVACPEFAAALDEFQGPQPAQGVVETAAIRFVTGFGRNFLFSQRIGIVSGSGYAWVSVSRISRSAFPNRPRQ
jgi:hypothetical protein